MKIKDVLYFLGLLYWKRIDLPCQWLGFRANVREIVLLTAIYRVVLQIVFFLCGNQQGWLVTQRLDTFMEWLLYLFCWKIVVVFILLSQSCKKRRIWIYAYIYVYQHICTIMYIYVYIIYIYGSIWWWYSLLTGNLGTIKFTRNSPQRSPKISEPAISPCEDGGGRCCDFTKKTGWWKVTQR